MTTTDTGSGELAFRVVVERSPVSWVTHQSMENAAVSPQRHHGLSVTGKIKHIVNPLTMESEVSSLGVRIADLHGHATDAYARRPSLRTWLTANMTTAAATATVVTTTGWPTTGSLWIDSEAIAYTGKTGTTFTGCTRAQLSSQLQAHYVSSGGVTRYPEVTNKPVTLAGARAWVYRYEQTDDPQGNGTLFWTGIVTKDPAFDGVGWTFAIEPLSVLLERQVNSDLAEALVPRGIYYPTSNPFRCTISGPVVSGHLGIALDGFYETNEEFVAALNALVTASSIETTLGLQSIAFVADGDTSWHVEMLTGAAPATSVSFRVWPASRSGSADADPVFDEFPVADPTDPTSPPVSSLLTNTPYWWLPTGGTQAGAGSVPRGYFGAPPHTVYDPADTHPPYRLYMGGASDLTGIPAAQVSFSSTDTTEAEDAFMGIATYSSATRYLDFYRPRGGTQLHAFTSQSLPEVRLGRQWTESGSLGDALAAMVAAVPAGLNAGSVPPLRAADFEATLPNVFPARRERVVNSRTFTSFGGSTLMEIVRGECLLAGYAVGLSSTGLIKFFELAPPLAGSVLTGTPTTGMLVVDHPTGDPQWSSQSRGNCNQVAVSRGYVAQDDEYSETKVIVRDVVAFGQSPRPFTVQIEPKSRLWAALGAETYAECVEVSRRLFAIFAHPYQSIRVDCDFRYLDRDAGDTVFVSSPRIPDAATGLMGVENMPMLVIGREVDPYRGRVSLHGIAVVDKLAAYTPSFQIASEVNVSGNTWDLTLTMGSYTASDFFEADYGVRVWEFDGTTATVIGSVVSVTGAVVRVTFVASAAAITAGTWFLGWRHAVDGIQFAQTSNAFMADSAAFIDDGADGLTAKVFS